MARIYDTEGGIMREIFHPMDLQLSHMDLTSALSVLIRLPRFERVF